MTSPTKLQRNLIVVTVFNISLLAIINISGVLNQYERQIDKLTEKNVFVDVTVIVLTYKKHDALAKVLPSVLKQRYSDKFEVILADNGCFDETKTIYDNVLGNQSIVPNRYLPICSNPGYAIGNNEAAKLASPTSQYLLLLNDDIVLSNTGFIQNMVDLARTKEDAAAVGCKILDRDGTVILEAGSIVWKDASTAGVGRGRKDINAPEFLYPKPVDYVSGTCLLVERSVFDGYGGFDGEHFPNYYEDTDLQLHIQHDLGKEVWLQPRAVGLHDEHGTFRDKEIDRWVNKGQKIFYEKWKHALEAKHVNVTYGLGLQEREKAFFMAADLRARNPKRANILYFDSLGPNKFRGSGFGRSFDNLSMISELGHRVTLVTLNANNKDWCDKECLNEIRGLGIEYVDPRKLESRIGYYDIVIVSRPSTLYGVQKQLLQKLSPFSFIYDCEALWFRRNEMLNELVKSENIEFPGYVDMVAGEIDRKAELSMIGMADTVLTVSKGEKKVINSLMSDAGDVRVVGHISDSKRMTKTSFSDREGILFLAAFHRTMYYNGDAIWYFLKNIYPFLIKALEASSQDPIPLTITGRGIPATLREMAEDNDIIAPYVTFLESPPTIDHLFEEHRIFIAPHLYGAGIQYEVSEALSLGIPVVMSTFTQESFGDVPGCVGSDAASYIKCIIDLHGDESQWEALRKEGISYIEKTHSREETMAVWSKVINDNFRQESL